MAAVAPHTCPCPWEWPLESARVLDAATRPPTTVVAPVEPVPVEAANSVDSGSPSLSSEGVGACVTVTVMVTEWDRNPVEPRAPNLPVIFTVNVVCESGLTSGSTKHLILTVAPGIS